MKRETWLDKEIGYKFTSKETTITPEDLDTFYNLVGEVENIFVDDEAAKSLELKYKGKIVAGMFLIVMSSRLGLALGPALAADVPLVGMNDVRFMSPAYPGDTLRLEGELLGKRPTSKGHVVVDWKWILKNQNDTVIACGVNTELFPKATIS